MLTIRTKSGAEYLVDQEQQRVKRVGPPSPGIDYESNPDGVWEDYLGINWGTDEPGTSVGFILSNGTYRLTTPVVEFIDD